jgi:hypothetical protein
MWQTHRARRTLAALPFARSPEKLAQYDESGLECVTTEEVF